MQLPCRGCSDAQTRLEEAKHPLSTFACRDAGYQKAWAEISRGQHLLCPNCKREAGMTMDGGIMFCDVCGNLKAKLQLSNAQKQRWTDDTEKSFTCLRCAGKRQASRCYPCVQCGRLWLASGFESYRFTHCPRRKKHVAYFAKVDGSLDTSMYARMP